MSEALLTRRRSSTSASRIRLTFSVLVLGVLNLPCAFFNFGQVEKPKPPLTPARQNDVASVSPEPTVKSAKIFNAKKIVLVLSDASGRTASGLLAGVLAQFSLRETIEVQTATQVTSKEKLKETIDGIQHKGPDVLVLATLVDSTLSGWAKTFCEDYNLQFVEVMGPLLDQMGSFLDQESKGEPGASLSDQRSINQILNNDFFRMVEAVKYSQRHIGGLNSQDWHEADIILVGPSRCGKGPVAHQLAMRGYKAAALNISPYDMLPEELESIQPHQVALITLEEPRLLRLRQNRAAEMKAQKRSMLLEDDYAEPARVRKDLELTAELQSFNPQWREAVDMTYLSPEECAAVLIRQVKQDRDAAALRLQ